MKKVPAWAIGVPVVGFVALMVFGWMTVTPEKISLLVGAKRVVRSQLRDGSSADFRNITVYKTAGGEVVCGEVNARIGFGAMAGYSRFFYRGGGIAIMADQAGEPDIGGIWSAEDCDGSKGGVVAFG